MNRSANINMSMNYFIAEEELIKLIITDYKLISDLDKDMNKHKLLDVLLLSKLGFSLINL